MTREEAKARLAACIEDAQGCLIAMKLEMAQRETAQREEAKREEAYRKAVEAAAASHAIFEEARTTNPAFAAFCAAEEKKS